MGRQYGGPNTLAGGRPRRLSGVDQSVTDSVRDSPPLIAHVIHRLGMGGMENGLVNLINHLPHDAWRHAIISLTDATDFAKRIKRDDITIHCLNKREGKDLSVLWKLWRVFRTMQPDAVHSRNLAALEAQLPAALAGVRVRIHGEHGRDIYDLTGDNRKYLALRRCMRPFISRYVPMSKDLSQWLKARVGVPQNRITQLYNGVDSERFTPRTHDKRADWPVRGLRDGSLIVVGAVGRMEAVKDPLNLVRAFIELDAGCDPAISERLRLVYLGAGPLLEQARSMLAANGLSARCWLPGARDDVQALLPGFDVFVLPSLGEGISNTVLEAMSCALPVVATAVGGTPELVTRDTGILVKSGDYAALAGAMGRYVHNEVLRGDHGRNGRTRVETEFALPVMVHRYHCLYRELLS